MWSAEIVHPDDGRDWLAISLSMDTLTLELTRAFCDAVYNTIKNRVIGKDMRDVNRLVDLMTDLHQIIQEETERSRT